MSEYFLYFLVTTTFVFACMWYDEQRRHFTTKAELDTLKNRQILVEAGNRLGKNKEEYDKALAAVLAEPVPKHMLEYVTGASTTSPGGVGTKSGAGESH